jgi:two-component system sensor histidine kinase KdpD
MSRRTRQRAAGAHVALTAAYAAMLLTGTPRRLLIYLVAVVAIAIAGRFWPAVLAAIAASLLLNWFSLRRCTPSRSTSRRISWRCCCTSRSP